MALTARAARRIRRGLAKAALDAPTGYDTVWMLRQPDPLACEAYGRAMRHLVSRLTW